MVWDSAWWFAPLIGSATVGLAATRLALFPYGRETTGTLGDGIGAVACVVGLYAVTALTMHVPVEPSTTLIYSLAVVIWWALGAGVPAAVCGLTIAVTGPVVEVLLSRTGAFNYADGLRGLWGVPWWLPGLYFAFGAVASRLGELAVVDRAGHAETIAATAA